MRKTDPTRTSDLLANKRVRAGGSARGASPRLTAVEKATATLREEVLARHESGWLVGSEDDLLKHLGVSRPTLRQALRVLEGEGLLTVRRGVGGGVYGQIPSSEAVARMAAVCLRSRGTDTAELMVAVGAVSAEIARLAASSPERASLLAWVEAHWPDTELVGRMALDLALEFGSRLADLAGNAPLRLFEEVLHELAMAPSDTSVFAIPERAAFTQRQQHRLAEAVAAGDADLAVALSRSHTAAVVEWLSPVAEPGKARRSRR